VIISRKTILTNPIKFFVMSRYYLLGFSLILATVLFIYEEKKRKKKAKIDSIKDDTLTFNDQSNYDWKNKDNDFPEPHTESFHV